MADIFGTNGNDTLVGTAGDDWMHPGSGDDVVNGAGGSDHIFAGPGADVVDGGAGNDFIDVDLADGAIDLLTGGAGADRFIFSINGHSSTLAAADRIRDFSSAEGDRLEIGGCGKTDQPRMKSSRSALTSSWLTVAMPWLPPG